MLLIHFLEASAAPHGDQDCRREVLAVPALHAIEGARVSSQFLRAELFPAGCSEVNDEGLAAVPF